MTTAAPDLPPYEPERILGAPFPERFRLVCRTWASYAEPCLRDRSSASV